MNFKQSRLVALTAAFVSLWVGVQSQAFAQTDWPVKGKPLTMLIGFAAGASTDVGARLMASGLEKELGVNVTPVNKPGASSQLMYTELSKSKPDGSTFGTINFPSAIVSSMDPERQATYSRKSFELLALHIVDPGIIAVLPTSPYKTLADVIAAAKAKPRSVTVTTTGIQSDEHFALLQLEELTGAKFAFVHFSTGTATAMAPFMGGKVDVFAGNVADVIGQVKAGQIKVLGVMDNVRSHFYPDVKTFEEQGYKLYNSANRGFALPAGTPKAIVDKLSLAMKKVSEKPEHKKLVEDMGLTLRYLSPTDYAKFWEEYSGMVKRLLPLTKE